MHVLDFYKNPKTKDDLRQILTLGAQKHPEGLPDFFLEKDLWVTEILRLLYEESLLGDFARVSPFLNKQAIVDVIEIKKQPGQSTE